MPSDGKSYDLQSGLRAQHVVLFKCTAASLKIDSFTLNPHRAVERLNARQRATLYPLVAEAAHVSALEAFWGVGPAAPARDTLRQGWLVVHRAFLTLWA
jgi:hypothetical protein